ncbi:MAG: transposase [Acidobacteria bacterium]|nr:transposase [Acidobacteriota bacterium]MCA1628481.1 transposase [Acidobacteriota bacterium]
MLTLPFALTSLIVGFAPLFSKPVWEHVQVLLVGAILAPGKRTVTSALRVMGLSRERHFQTYHRVLNRAVWSSLAASRILLSLLVATFVPEGALVFALDDTIERRRGAQIKATGIYRDPVRSSHSHFVKASGLRWLSLMLTLRLPWAERVWALPVLTALCPSERYYEERGRRHKKLTVWARQMMQQVKRWLPEREVVVVADSSFAALELLTAVRREVTMITRLRMDAALYEPAPERQPRQNGRPRLKGARLPTLAAVLKDQQTVWAAHTVAGWYGGTERVVEVASATAVWYHTGMPPVPIRWVLVRDPLEEFAPQALLSTNLESDPVEMLRWFVRRWAVEVTFEEARAHLGMETQRQWSDKAIARTTPALLALFSVVTLLAHERYGEQQEPFVRQAAWYVKRLPTFSDALATVRRQLWREVGFRTSRSETDNVKLDRALLDRLTDALCYAA